MTGWFTRFFNSYVVFFFLFFGDCALVIRVIFLLVKFFGRRKANLLTGGVGSFLSCFEYRVRIIRIEYRFLLVRIVEGWLYLVCGWVFF